MLVVPCFAGITLNMPELTAGSYWDFVNDDVSIGGYLILFDFNKMIYGSLGLITNGKDDPIPSAGLSINVPTFINNIGGNWQAKDLLIGLYIGKDFNAHEWHWGLFAGILLGGGGK